MKILYQSRVDLYDPKGGDTVQMEKTKEAIERIDSNIKIDIKPVVQYSDINKYDIVHLFNLDWICETYPQILWAKQNGKKIVLSAIHHSEKEVLTFENKYKFDIRRIYNLIFTSQGLRDEWKNVYRTIFDFKKFYPTLIQLVGGIRNLQREIIELSDKVLVQTNVEAEDIKKDFDIKLENWVKVVNGVDKNLFQNTDDSLFLNLIKERNKKIILNVGRIEPRKNQLSLIKAYKELKKKGHLEDYILVFIGAYSKYSPEYKYRFKRNINNKDIFYLGVQPQKVVASAMASEGIYVHPSWFETTGLVALEALVSGMKIVIAGKRAEEYFGLLADYCNPDNIESIKKAILLSVDRNKINQKDINKIADLYNWDETAKQTIKVYKELLNK